MKKTPLPALFLVIITALVYLPNIGGLTYFKDDWYYIYDGLIGGAKIFHEMFSIDRPARGYFFEWYFLLLGAKPLAWHIGAYLWRTLSALGALWIFNILWEKEKKIAFISALLFAIYPGYYWWMSAIEYQPMITSLALQVFSIAFTLKGLQVEGYRLKVAYAMGAVLTGWAYIALVDYAIGMEVFRFLAVYVMIARRQDTNSTAARNKFRVTVKRVRDSFYALNGQLLIPIGFVFWRTFFFNNEREATDIGLQLGAFFGSPISTGTRWILQTLNSLLNMTALAWVNQFPRFFFELRMRDMAYGILFAILTLLAVFLARKTSGGDSIRAAESNSTLRESALLGGLGLILGILPVIMANRYIDNGVFSHYALPASLAAALLVSSLIHSISMPRIQSAVMYIVILFAALTHYGISISAVNEARALEKFWWQVSWRAPALASDTMLVIHYPSANMGDDGNGATELPNMIYFPQSSASIPVHYNLSAITLNDTNLREVMLGKLYMETDYRSHTVNLNYENVLVISQPTPTSCAHVVNGNAPLISFDDPASVILAAPSSNLENVIANAQPHIPPNFAFGDEPERNWCYYFEKADLAAQLQQWDEVTALGEEAIKLELHPQDQSEWMPFLKAYAITGNDKRMKQTASKIGIETVLRLQACEMLTKIEEPLRDDVKDIIATHYCKNAQK